MAHLTVQRLFEDAQTGTILNAEDRRRVIAWLANSQGNRANTELAEVFGVTEGTIRKDKIAIRQAMAKEVKEDDIALVIADILWDFKRQIATLEDSMKHTKPGTTERRKHSETIMSMRLQTVKALQDLGYLPKNLGNMTTEIFEYAAVVVADQLDTRPLALFDDETRKEIQDRARKELKGNSPVLEGEKRTIVYEDSSTGELSQDIEITLPSYEEENRHSSSSAATPEAS